MTTRTDLPKLGRLIGTSTTEATHPADSRGVFRVFDVSIDDTVWRIWRDAPGFSQRFLGRFAEGDEVIEGSWELREDDINWKPDLQITYRRSPR